MERLVLPPDEAAKALGVTERTLERWRYEGRGPAFVKQGKRVAYEPDALREHIKASRRHPGGGEKPAA